MEEHRPDSPGQMPYRFCFGPFEISSAIDVPELRNSARPGAHPVALRVGGVPGSISGAASAGEHCQVAANEYLLTIPDVARYYVRDGNQVRVEIVPGAPIANVTTYLLGSVFGVLCHQNGLLPLHASAVEHDGTVTAFLGDSGAGKSTLAACLWQRGHRVISDDICLLDPAGDTMRVIAVAEWLKLWRPSLDHIGESAVEEHRVYSTDDKFRLYLSGNLPREARLGRIVFLGGAAPDANQTAASDEAPTLERMSIVEAVAGLFDMTYVSYVPALTGQKARIFQQCARALAHAHTWRLTRPWGLDRMGEVLDLIERDVLAAGPTSP